MNATCRLKDYTFCLHLCKMFKTLYQGRVLHILGFACLLLSLNSNSFFYSRYVAIYPYTPRKEDELELRKGEMFLVFERCQDGWFKGTSMHTSKIGVFPGNYVAPVTRYGFE